VRHGLRSCFQTCGWYDSSLAMGIRRFLRGRLFSAAAMCCLFAALFFSELWSIGQVPTNTELDVLLTVVFAVFALEFVGLAITDTSYFLGFFFWMDFVGTASMAFDISYMAGADATQPDRVSRRAGSSSSENVTFVRAARAARLGARAGRISRVLKILRFLPFLFNSSSDHDAKVKVARVISNQLTNVLSTRVAFLTICVVVVLPFLSLFTFPEVDESMAAWAEVLNRNAAAFRLAWSAGNATGMALERDRLLGEVQRLAGFYAALSYGPFRVQFGETSGDTFVPRTDVLDIQVPLPFEAPSRRSSMRIVSQDMLQVSFNLATPKQMEAAAAIGLICFIIGVMCCFGLVMSSSIGVIALHPLERMLSVVRQRCKQIFKYTDDLQVLDRDSQSDRGSELEDMEEHASEFVLLERVVSKLAAIVHLSTAKQEPEVGEAMNENDIMVLNWMQGAQVPANFTSPSRSLAAGGRGQLEGPTAFGSLQPELIEELDTPHFNPLDMSKETRVAAAAWMLMSHDGCSAWVCANVREAQLAAFVDIVESKYNSSPFHNFAHAVDVEYSVCRYMRLIEAQRFLSEAAQFWLLVAAVGHDVGHPGVNNQYLIEIGHELALRYNDRSPLENMHCAKLFQVLGSPEANVFSQVERDVYKETRKGMISAILHTDVVMHNQMVKDMSMLYQMNSEAFDGLDPTPAVTQSQANVQLVLNGLLHGADVGNPMKPWELCRRYAFLCLDEFFAQGDLEKAAGIPVQMLNDRDKVNRPNSQVGFIEFFIAPMVTAMVGLFPQLDGLALHLGQNILRWCDVWAEETSPSPEALGKVLARAQKVAAACEASMRCKDGGT